MSDKLTEQLQHMERSYESLKHEFERDGTISSGEQAQLDSVSRKLSNLRARVVERNKGQVTLRSGGAQARSKPSVEIGEGEVAKQVALGSLSWGGRYRGKLWAMTDSQGGVVRSGATRPLQDLAGMNGKGARALAAIGDLEALDRQWRAAWKTVQVSASRGTADLAKLEKALPAMHKRMKGDPDFYNDVNGYLAALAAAEKIVGSIRKAEKDFEKASHELRAAVFDQQLDAKSDEYKDAEDKLAAVKAEIEEAKKIFGGVMDIVIQVAKQDWEGLATKAVSFMGEKAIEAAYEPQIQELKKKLETAKSEMNRLKKGALYERIEAARSGLESAAIGYENAQAELKMALAQLARSQANARNELGESSSTAIAGQMVANRAKQLHAVATTRGLCARYLRDSAGVTQGMAPIAQEYSLIGGWLDNVGKSDASFRRGSAYVRTLEQSSLSNAVMLDNWRTWVSHVQRECQGALTWVNDAGPKGPMSAYDKSVDLIHKGLSG